MPKNVFITYEYLYCRRRLLLILDIRSLLVETDKVIDKIRSRNMASRLLKASSDERELTGIDKRLAQMSQRATFQILVSLARTYESINL